MKRAITILAVNIAVFCVAAEIVALAVFYFQHGWLFYIDPYRPTYKPIVETERQRLTSDGLHPYFGPIHSPGIPFDIPETLRATTSPTVKTNNFGFASPHDYPFSTRGQDQFVIGIFGGSVGVWFCQVGAERLIEGLKRAEFFKNRQLVTLCFSHEGYKQPQQLLVLTYFLSIGQRFDLVVNIDGFNEVALATINTQRGSDISMPSAVHLDPLVNLVNQSTLTPEKLESLARIDGYKRRLNGLAGRINRSRLASLHLALEQYYAFVDGKYRAELAVFDTLPSIASASSVIKVTPVLAAREGAELFQEIARQWIGSSMLMHDLLAQRGTGYFHVLQPNQYSTSRRFGGQEARVALSEASPFKESVEKGYPFLIEGARSTAQSGGSVRVFDATRIFDAEPSAVYIDNCCHYTRRGNDILADFIARSVLSSPGPWAPVSGEGPRSPR